MSRDWVAWHARYDEPGSPLARRLAIVQSLLADALDAAPAGPINLISACAGQGRDVISVLPRHARRGDVRALLVELDADNCMRAEADAAAAGIQDNVTVRQADAGDTAAYDGLVPAHVAVFCGVFGNVNDGDVRRTIGALPSLCAAGATVLWTRHQREPDLTPLIRRWFAAEGFSEVAFEALTGEWVSVGAHRLDADPVAYEKGKRMFTFTDD